MCFIQRQEIIGTPSAAGPGKAAYGFGMHVARVYDPATSRLIDLKYTQPDGTVISDFAYTHDGAGNILSKTTDFGLVQYGYDALDRLVLADYDWKADETFAYDAVGNRTADANHPVWQYDAANQLLAYGAGPHNPSGQTPPTVPAFTFAYDANGSTVSKTDLAASTTDQYGYSFNNRMNEVRRDGELVARYFYDHMSQRVRKDLYTSGVLAGATWFAYGQEGLLVEYDAAANILKKYFYYPDHPWGSNPLWQTDLVGERHFFLNDQLFTSQRTIVQTLNTSWQAFRNAFGAEETASGNIIMNLRFSGQNYDLESSVHYNWHRYYDPMLGRYLQSDPLIINIFAYSNSNPVRYQDPTGLISGETCSWISGGSTWNRMPPHAWIEYDYGSYLGSIGFYPKNLRIIDVGKINVVGKYDPYNPAFSWDARLAESGVKTRTPTRISYSIRCACWTCEMAFNCIWEKAKKWEGSIYIFLFRDCFMFRDILFSECCLETKDDQVRPPFMPYGQ